MAMEEKALWWYTSPNGKGERQYRGLWREIKRPAIRERRIKRHGVDCQSSMRDQNRPGSLVSWLPLCRIVTISLEIPAFSHFRSLQGIHYWRYRCVYTRFTCEYLFASKYIIFVVIVFSRLYVIRIRSWYYVDWYKNLCSFASCIFIRLHNVAIVNNDARNIVSYLVLRKNAQFTE